MSNKNNVFLFCGREWVNNPFVSEQYDAFQRLLLKTTSQFETQALFDAYGRINSIDDADERFSGEFSRVHTLGSEPDYEAVVISKTHIESISRINTKYVLRSEEEDGCFEREVQQYILIPREEEVRFFEKIFRKNPEPQPYTFTSVSTGKYRRKAE